LLCPICCFSSTTFPGADAAERTNVSVLANNRRPAIPRNTPITRQKKLPHAGGLEGPFTLTFRELAGIIDKAEKAAQGEDSEARLREIV
jgi:hypothetical protein